jgi:hypothetical protein
MKPYYLIIALTLFLPACSRNSASDRTNNASEKKIRKQVTTVAERYIMSQLTEPEKTVLENGIIMIHDKQKGYMIEPSKIYTGLIDDDNDTDAIVSLATYQGQQQTVSEQLIILRTGRNFTLVSTLESDMIIISLKDRIITADVPEHSRDNPLFNCPSCREVVNYRFRMGELVKAE